MSKRLVIPDTMRISGCDWAVKVARLDGLYGQSADASKTIALDLDNCGGMFNVADTLLHEVMHSVLRQQGRLFTDEEEVYVRALATGLCGVFRDNPALLKYLTKALS